MNEEDDQMAGPAAQRFTLAIEKPQIIWSSSMDIVGIWSAFDRVIELHRVGYKH
jgi:hypothetical protein